MQHMDTHNAQSSTEQKPPQPLTNPSERNKRGLHGWHRYLMYLMALLGVLFVILVCSVAFDSWREGHQPIPETATIESTMTEAFGRYSEEHKGWLYVTDAKRSFVMRVVQQTSIDNKTLGDGLYFVASGTPLDDKQGTVYGVFYLYKEAKTGELRQIAELHHNYYDAPLSPDSVRFESLSHQVWAWVIKERSVSQDIVGSEYVVNVVLAPHDGEIKELARFNAREKTTPEGGCDKAAQDYAQWLKARDEKQASAAAAFSAASDVNVESEVEEEESEYEVPPRCDDLKWTYKTQPPRDDALSPLWITRTGTLQGEKQPEKSWKVMFDAKSFVYLMPDELK